MQQESEGANRSINESAEHADSTANHKFLSLFPSQQWSVDSPPSTPKSGDVLNSGWVDALVPHPIQDACIEMATKQVPIVQRTIVEIKPIEELVDELDEKYQISAPELRRHLAAEAAVRDLERIKTRGLVNLRSTFIH